MCIACMYTDIPATYMNTYGERESERDHVMSLIYTTSQQIRTKYDSNRYSKSQKKEIRLRTDLKLLFDPVT